MLSETETPVKQESIEELEARLARMKQQEREAKDRQRQAYENIKTETIETLCAEALKLNAQMVEFKSKAFESLGTIYEMLKEYSQRHEKGKGNFRIESGNFRITYKRQGRATFDERSLQAEKHIIDFVNSKFQDDQDTRDLIMSLLERKKGELDINLIQKLYSMEDRFDNENWKRGIALLKESYQYVHSKDYIGFEQRNAAGEWEPINLHFSNV